MEFTFSKSNEKLSAVPRGWSDIHEYLLHVSHTVVLYKHQLIFKTVLCEAISNLLQNWNTSTSTLRDFVHISPTFQMMPSQAKGPDPGSHTVLTCPDWLILMQSGTLPRSFLNFYDLNSFGGNQPDALWNVYQCRFAYCLLMLPLFGHQVESSCL